MDKRYFTISFAFSGFNFGDIEFETEDNVHPSRVNILKMIRSVKPELTNKIIIIINIHEFKDEFEYREYIRK